MAPILHSQLKMLDIDIFNRCFYIHPIREKNDNSHLPISQSFNQIFTYAMNNVRNYQFKDRVLSKKALIIKLDIAFASKYE